ncbi:MAG: VWA domain-containing protein [Chloroflexi bacterium]|nr:VWA domain-containing protein [Chloroflexota bacterium]
MAFYRYSRWDGTQEVFPLHEDEIMEELSDHLMTQGDVSSALKAMMQKGVKSRYGDRSQGIQDILQQLRSLKQQVLEQYDLNLALADIRKRLDQVVQQERQGIDRRLDDVLRRYQESRQRGQQGGLPSDLEQALLKNLQRLAEKNRAVLDNLPQDNPAGAIRQLHDYEFMDPEAKRQFDELLKELQQKMLDSFLKDLSHQLKGVTPQDLAGLKEMARHLNRMLEERMRGGEPDFQQFMQRYGHLFGSEPPQSLDELVDKMQHQIAQMQSLLDSMSPGTREQLRELLRSVFKDEELQDELSRLAANLESAQPMGHLRREYPFHGDDPLTLEQAMSLMGRLQKMDELDRQLRKTQQGADTSEVDSQLLRDVLGDEASQALEQIRKMTDLLEAAGYIRRVGNRFELTPRGMRKIGQKALHEIFAYIKKDRAGQHRVDQSGGGGERTDDTKLYEFGDPFHVDLHQTLMNAIERTPGVPVRMRPDDFEVFKTEQLAHSATVLMLDLSLSMAMRGNFLAAKKVALALDNLIRTQFPRDNLFIVGFSTYAREVKPEKLPYLSWDEFDPYTNIQHGLALSQKLLTKVRGGTNQIIMISDGEPTAHIEGGQLFLQYPPSPRTVRETLREVRRCTQKGIIINTFMLDRNSYLVEFIDQLTRINRGRVFYTTPERLGQYILVDYLSSRKRRILF